METLLACDWLFGNIMLMTSSLLYENPIHMTFFNISTAFTPRQNLPSDYLSPFHVNTDPKMLWSKIFVT